jgi:hypothetical protein
VTKAKVKAAQGWLWRVLKMLWRLILGSRQLVVGARFPQWMRECPDWVAGALTIGAGFTGSMTGISQGAARGWWVAGAVAFAVFAILLAAARSIERLRTRDIVERVSNEFREDRQNLLGNQLTNLIQLVAEAIAQPDPMQRLQVIGSARGALIGAAANLVGRKTAAGTVRANLFELQPDGRSMVLGAGGFSGRGVRSDRVFLPGDRTFDLTVVEQSRFVRSVKDELIGHERNLPYETFLTYPVSIGRKRIYGVLTVDSMKTGDLDSAEDHPMMAILTALLAITYECQKSTNPAISSGK